jgi:hypothetical protein
MAGYQAIRADEVKATNLIHLDILKKLIEAPIAICDLSSRNPNVLFELGIRQAFDKPVVLIQEFGTPRIFDITPLRYLEYSKEMKYHEVLKSQDELKEAILATVEAGSDQGNVNSIVRLMALNNPATIPDIKGDKESMELGVMRAELQELRKLIETTLFDRTKNPRLDSIYAIEYDRISSTLDQLQNTKGHRIPDKVEQLHQLMQEIDELMQQCEEKPVRNHFRNLSNRVYRATLN